METVKAGFKREFQIYKDGEKDKLTILSKDGMPFDREAKIKLHLSLGFRVFDMDNNEIK